MHASSLLQANRRHVRRLHLRVTDAAHGSRLAITIGDALRTASLPATDTERLIVIRRVELDGVDVGASPASLGLLLEHAVRAANSRAVRFDTPGAPAAEAVYFPSRAHALAALAHMLAQHEDLSAWFWPQVVPGWQRTVTRAARWRCMLGAAHVGEGAALLAATVVARAIAADSAAMAEILTAITRPDAALWLFTLGYSHRDRDAAAAPLELDLSPPTKGMLANARARLAGDDDPRLVWLGTLLAIHERPIRAAQSDLPARIAAWIKHGLGACFPRPHGEPAPSRLEGMASTRPAGGHEPERVDDIAPRAPQGRRSQPVAPDEIAASERAAATSVPSRMWSDRECESSHAGLLLILPILRRLGVGSHLASHPELAEAAFPARLLAWIGRRAGLRDEDPLARVLAELADDAAAVVVPASCFQAWFAAVRCWSRRHRINWHEIVQRPGKVRTDRVHLEVLFDPRQVDIRLRRLALDADPGWVPWLGRVVRFHYLSPDERLR